MENHKQYWVFYEQYGCLEFYNVIEKGKGIIDRIQPRTFNKLIKMGIITHEQYKLHQKL